MKLQILPAVLLCALPYCVHAQTQFTIFLNDGNVLQIPTSEIDSITYAWASLGELATVSTAAQAINSPDGISISGAVTAEGAGPVSARGFCWSTVPDPTTADNILAVGAGPGAFTAMLPGSALDTTCYVRAFATNSEGTAFGAALTVNASSGGLQGAGVVDIDGNAYTSVIIGEQEWMAQNLRASRYANGDSIFVSNNYYGYLPTDDTAATSSLLEYNGYQACDIPCGKSYNFYACIDSRNVCPAGWHVPSEVEWDTLFLTVSPMYTPTNNQLPRELLCQTGTSFWTAPNMASDAYGFGAVPNNLGLFSDVTYGEYWTSTPYLLAEGRVVLFYSSSLDQGSSEKSDGFAIRCLKD